MMTKQIENTKAYKDLDSFKQDIVMKRSNRLQIEDAVVTARAITFEKWQESTSFSASWQNIVKEVLAS
ncbi:hypothetical protein R1T16_17385 [Flavobacterium sp. DG1-102-2]|uniref:hypothetical protein n=1 Tax=Flavobacterium sp. DG1-102-2 TaxID=3081663 RepID=UPI002949A248|nr:hypothetical protein [Flavobacterium sp. DG1-102-2]MDV6170213.1 hypothetical protein [Flavobacterium sp. DG1-102-2]